MRIEWTAPAKAALEEYLDYLQSQRPASRIRATADIQDSVGKLSAHAFIGRPSRWPGLRELSLTRWRKIAVYRVAEDAVFIVAFYDARQDLTAVKPED